MTLLEYPQGPLNNQDPTIMDIDVDALARELPELMKTPAGNAAWNEVAGRLGHGHDRLDVENLFTVVLAAALRQRGLDAHTVQHKVRIQPMSATPASSREVDVVTLLVDGMELGLHGAIGQRDSVRATLRDNHRGCALLSIEESLVVDQTVYQEIDDASADKMAQMVDIWQAGEVARMLREAAPSVGPGPGKPRL